MGSTPSVTPRSCDGTARAGCAVVHSSLEETFMKSIRRVIAVAFAVSTVFATAAMAQTADVPGHPRVNEVNQRIDNQQNRISNGVANGTVNGKQAARDETRDANIAQRASADEAKHNGHLTKKETRNLNRAENRNSRDIRRQKAH